MTYGTRRPLPLGWLLQRSVLAPILIFAAAMLGLVAASLATLVP